MRVMVTGGAGFIGSTLVDRLLAEGCDVDVIDDLSTGALGQPHRGARRSATASSPSTASTSARRSSPTSSAHRRPEVIFHLAAQLDVRVSVAKPLFDAEVNILGSLNVCEAALAAGMQQGGVRRVGRHALRHPRRRSRRARATRSGRSRRTASSKKAAGDYLHYYREVRGLEYTELALGQRLRPAPGPARRGGRRRDLRGAHARGPPAHGVFGDGAQTRDFVFVDDVVDAFVRATEKGGGLLMNIGTGVETSVLRALRRDGAAHRLRGASPTARRRVPASSNARRSIPVAPRSTSAGSRGPTLDEGLGLHRRLVPRRHRLR